MIKISIANQEKCLKEHLHVKHYIDFSALQNREKKCLEEEIENILLAKPEEFESIIEWAKVKHLDTVRLRKAFGCDKKPKNVGYKKFATKSIKTYSAYSLAKALGVNVCPYCNRNYTFTIKTDKVSARPQFDHFYDKATYPILALSFYNLIPSCATCNATMKGTKPFSLATHAHPYVEGFGEKARFVLHVKESSFCRELKGFDIEFKSSDAKVQNNINDFGLEELYENHKDIVLELIQKSVMYNESYLDELMQNYEGSLFKNREDLLRLVFGGYIADEDLGKRPLSKLTKDILEQLDIV